LPRWAETRIWNEDDDLDPLDPILARFPGPVVITDSKGRRIAICAGVTLLVALIAWAWSHVWYSRDDWNLFQAMGSAFAAIILIGAELSVVAGVFFDLGSITLDADGFEVRGFWTTLRRSWTDVDGFKAEWASRTRRVSYIDTSPATEAVRLLQSILGNRGACGTAMATARTISPAC